MENTDTINLLTFDEQTIREIYQYALKFTDNPQVAMLLTRRALPHIVDYNTLPRCTLHYPLSNTPVKSSSCNSYRWTKTHPSTRVSNTHIPSQGRAYIF